MKESFFNSKYEFEAIGTHWYIGTREPLSEVVKSHLQQRIAVFDKTYSRFRNDSLVATIAGASNGGTFEFPTDSLPLFELYDILYQLTNGKVDPLIGRELELLGYDAKYSLQSDSRSYYHDSEKKLANWAEDIIREDSCVSTRRSVTIDVGAAGKGYLVDILSEILMDDGITNFLIDGSGDIRHAGEGEMIIGLEHPTQPQMVIGTVSLKDNAICASATNRRKWGNGLHHVLDGRTGKPVQDVIATWAIAENALLADGLATALFFTDAKKLSERFHFSSVKVFADMHVDVSENFEGTLFTR